MLKYLSGRVGAALAVAGFALGLVGLYPAKSQQPAAPARQIRVIRDKSRTLRLPYSFSTAIMGNLDIADVLPESDTQIYIQGKKVGTTNITLYDQNKRLVGIIDLDVTLDIEQIRKQDSFRH